MLFPRSRILTVVPLFFWPFFFELPAVTYLGLWFLLQLISGTASLAGVANAGGIAWWAHLGGFGAGVVLHWLFVSKARTPRRRQADEVGWDEEWRRFFG